MSDPAAGHGGLDKYWLLDELDLPVVSVVRWELVLESSTSQLDKVVKRILKKTLKETII